MTELYIIRHAWAEDRHLLQWPTDWERPLTRDGRRRFAAVVAQLADRGFQPEVIATSPLVRCRETAEIIAEGVGNGAPIVELDALQPGSDLGAMLAWTTGETRRRDHVAWVGHAPDVGRMAAWLTAAGPGEMRFAKGAVAAIQFAAAPAVGQGELRWFVTAKALGC